MMVLILKLFFNFQQQKRVLSDRCAVLSASNFTSFGTGLLQKKKQLDKPADSPIAQFAVI